MGCLTDLDSRSKHDNRDSRAARNGRPDDRLDVYRAGSERLELVGRISRKTGGFEYDPAYLAGSSAAPVSCSLPLRTEGYGGAAARPYFEGLLPEGNPRSAAASLLQVRDDDYLSLLAEYGLDCAGDLVVAGEGGRLREEGQPAPGHEPVDVGDLANDLASCEATARINRVSRLSLAGTQNKVGLFHDPGEADLRKGWYSPAGGAPATHVLKTSERHNVPYLEFLCTRAAGTCGVPSARVHLVDLGGPVLCSERFDRAWTGTRPEGGAKPDLVRLHQEDLTQAFGLPHGSKYAELEGGTAKAVATFIRERSANPLADLEAFARLSLFNYLIGNCDNHLKNISVIYAPDRDAAGSRGMRLAPAYDIFCTTWFPGISREMGMALGGERDIDAIGPAHLVAFAQDIGLASERFATMCATLAAHVDGAIDQAARDAAADFDELEWKAEDLHEDIAPRKRVLERAAKEA